MGLGGESHRGLSCFAVAYIAIVCAFLLMDFALFHFASQEVTIEVVARTRPGTELALMVNEEELKNSTTIEESGESRYFFGPVPHRIRRLSLDVSGGSHTDVEIQKIEVLRNGKQLKSLPPSALNTALDEDFSFFGGRLRKLQNYLDWAKDPENREAVFFLVVGLFFLWLAGFRGSKTIRVWLPLVFVVAAGVWALTHTLISLGGVPPPTSIAVSGASFANHSKSTDILVCIASLTLSVALGVGLALMWQKRCPAETKPCYSTTKRSFSWIFFAVVLAVLFLIGFPNITHEFNNLNVGLLDIRFDQTCQLAWRYFCTQGWLPFRDFWYPYGGFSEMLAPFPYDLFRLHLHLGIVFLILGYSIYELVDRSKTWTSLILLAVVYAFASGYCRSMHRYFLSLVLVLFVLVITHKLPTTTRKRYLAWILCGFISGWAFAFEATQLAYVFPAVCFLVALQWYCDNANGRKGLIKQVGIGFVVFVLCALAYLSILASKGQLSGWWNFHTNLGLFTQYASGEAHLERWAILDFSKHSLIYTFLLGSLSYGSFLFVFKRGWQGACTPAIVLLTTGLLLAVPFIKMINRPLGPEHEILSIVIVGLLLVIYQWSKQWNRLQYIVAFLVLGRLTLYCFETGFMRDTWNSRLAAMKELPRSIEILLGGNQLHRPKIEAYFSPRRFMSPALGNEGLIEYLEHLRKQPTQPSVYDMQESPFVYILLGKKPPRYINHFDLSPIMAQHETIRWLQAEQPDIITWNLTQTAFDGVPNEVRVPLVFSEVISHYYPAKKLGSYYVLERRGEAQPIDLSFWRQELGSTINLGAIPAFAKSRHLPPCQAGQPCQDHLSITLLSRPTNGKKRRIPVQIGSYQFDIEFQEVYKVDTYHIFLDRIWFWNVAKRKGLTPTLLTKQTADSLRIEQLQKAATSEVLY